jgi:hypothetical protein
MLGHAGCVIQIMRPEFGCHKMRRKPLEDGAMPGVIEHLRLALEVLKAGGRAELRLHVLHERRDCAVPAWCQS